MSRFIGMDAVDFFARISRIYGNVLLMPTVVLFLICVIFIMRKTILSGRRFLFLLAGIGVPLCIILLAVTGGTLPPLRSQYALPLAFAFMLFFLIKTYKKKAAVIVACLALLAAVYQAQISAQLYYSDQMRYNEDVRLAYELNNLIIQAQPQNMKLPVAIAGNYDAPSRFHANFLVAEAIGRSIFFQRNIYDSTHNGLALMRNLGIYFDTPDEGQLEQALNEAVTMPPYPDPGCVKRTQDFIVIRISEELY